MTEAMKITLSTQPADARWGEKATYSINNDGITLHLNGADDLGLIQRAARKIDGLGIKHVRLSGEGWDADRCWAFWQGYKAPKGTRTLALLYRQLGCNPAPAIPENVLNRVRRCAAPYNLAHADLRLW